MRTLFLAWQAPIDRALFPVGRLDACQSQDGTQDSYADQHKDQAHPQRGQEYADTAEAVRASNDHLVYEIPHGLTSFNSI